jgi:hypothetical protein
MLSVVLAGYPKLQNDLRRSSMEEIGSRSDIGAPMQFEKMDRNETDRSCNLPRLIQPLDYAGHPQELDSCFSVKPF